MKVESIQPSDYNTYWNYKRKKESKRRKEEQKIYDEIENGIKNKEDFGNLNYKYRE